MLAWVGAATGLIGAIGALVAAFRATQTHTQVKPSNGDTLAKMFEDHVDDDFRSFSAIRTHLGIAPDTPKETAAQG